MELLIWLVPLAALVAGVRSPRGGLMVLAASLPLFGSPPGGPYLAAFDVAALIAIAAAFREPRPPRSLLDWPVWAFAGVSIATLVPLAYRPPSWHPRVLLGLLAELPDAEPWTPLFGWRALASLLVGVGLYHATRRAFAGRSLRPLLVSLLTGAAATLALGLAAHTGLLELEFFRVKGGPVWETRLHSLFFHSGWLAEFLVIVVPVAAAALAGFGSRGRQAAALLIALTLPTIFLTEQRGAWFTVLGQIVLVALLWGRALVRRKGSRRALLAAAALVPLLVGVGLLTKPDLFTSAVERTRLAFAGQARYFIWDVALEMTRERPVLGWGIGSFSPVYHEVLAKPRPGVFDWLTAHNQYLMLSAERGVVGLIAFGLLVAALWVAWAHSRARERPPPDALLARGLVIGIAGFLAYGLFQYMFFLKALEWLFWMLAAVAAVLAPRAESRTVERGAQVLLAVAALLVPWRALAVDPIEAEGDRAFGLHAPEVSGERTFQWTTGYAARRLPRPEDGTFELALVNGHPKPGEHRIEVTVRVDGAEALREQIGGSWRELSIDLGERSTEQVLVEIEVAPTFRPFLDYRRYADLEPSIDLRRLGVAVAFGEP